MTCGDVRELCRQVVVDRNRSKDRKKANSGSNKDVGYRWRGTAEQAWLIRCKWFTRTRSSLPTDFAEPAVEKGRHEPSSHADLASCGCEAG